MNKTAPLFVIAFLGLVLASPLALAQDPMKVGPHVYKCIFENERVRICEVRFKPGDSIGVHSHPDHFAYVLSPGKLRITPKDGSPAEAELQAGQVLWIPAEAHSAVNIGRTEARALVVELKEPASLESTLMQMERDWAQALIRGDVAAFERIAASDWILTGSGGETLSREQATADLRSGAMRFESFAVDDLKVRVFGDTAVVSGRSTEKSSYKGKDTSGQYRFTDVFVKRDGRWQAISTHVSKVEPQ